MASDIRFVGAIDAGANAVRAAVARVSGRGEFTIVARRHIPLRLGRDVFSRGTFGPKAVVSAQRAFRELAELFHCYRVERCRAVGTSALREATNRDVLIDAVASHAGLTIEPITGLEEANLLRAAVHRVCPAGEPPRVVADLGGGSMELSVLRGVEGRQEVFIIPVGPLLLLEATGVSGRISESVQRIIRSEVVFGLEDVLGSPPDLGGSRVVLCGDAAADLARIAPAVPAPGMKAIDVARLDTRVEELCVFDTCGRMQAYGLPSGRADVLGVSAIVCSALGQWLGAECFAVPPVGLLTGLLELLSWTLPSDRTRGFGARSGLPD